MPEQFLLVLHHGQYPVDLDIDDPAQGQGDQYKNDRKALFHPEIIRLLLLAGTTANLSKGYRVALPGPVADGVFNEGFTKKRDFPIKQGISRAWAPEKRRESDFVSSQDYLI
jgi:hypothetical protein